MNINIGLPQAQIGQCDQFIDSINHSQIVQVVITPLRLLMQTDNAYKLSFGCNFWKSCKNTNCSYTQAGMDAEGYHPRAVS